jgi:hypothetical protein
LLSLPLCKPLEIFALAEAIADRLGQALTSFRRIQRIWSRLSENAQLVRRDIFLRRRKPMAFTGVGKCQPRHAGGRIEDPAGEHIPYFPEKSRNIDFAVFLYQVMSIDDEVNSHLRQAMDSYFSGVITDASLA